MSVYIDNACIRYGRMIMCHMVADTPDELHAMAAAVGLSRKHYQSPAKASFPHYDICMKLKQKAIARGARQINRVQLARHIRDTKTKFLTASKTWRETSWWE